jgi:hypothetical protein
MVLRLPFTEPMPPEMGGLGLPPPGLVPPGAGPMGMVGPMVAPPMAPPPPPPMMAPPPPVMPPMPPPMMEPPPPPMPTEMQSPDLMARLVEILKPPIQPKYAPGYDKPPNPRMEDIIARAESARESNHEFIAQVHETLMMVAPRSGWGGYFKKDEYALRAGQMEQFRSSRLIQAHNKFVSFLSERPRMFSVEVFDPELYVDAQKIEDTAYHFRAMHERRWVDAGNPILSHCESWDLATYGMVIKRNTLNLADTKCPIKSVLVDPATVYPVWGHVGVLNGLEAVYRIVTMPVYQVIAEYAKDQKLTGKIKEAIGDKVGTFGESADVTVVEYWDTWWNGVFLCEGGVEIKPLAAHEYGCVPYIIQYGPGGEPMHTRHPDHGAGVKDYGEYGVGPMHNDRGFRATPFVEPIKHDSMFNEAMKTKALNNVLKSFNPPVLLERTNAAAKGELPIIENFEAGVTELEAGEEKLSLYPETANRDVGLIFQLLDQEAMGTSMNPASQGGMIDRSNVSGTARAGLSEENREQQGGWVRSLESLAGREASHDINKLWRNFGHDSRYLSGSKKAYYVPARNPLDTEDRAFELTPEIIDNVDTDIDCSMNSLRMSEMIPFANAMTMMGPESPIPIYTLRDIAQKAGVTDIDRVMAENQTYVMLKRVRELEETGKLILVPQALEEAIAEAEGNPAAQDRLRGILEVWMQMVAKPMQSKVEQSMAPPAPPPAPPGVAGGAGMPYAELGQGPMTQGGGPTGPQGPILNGPPMG